MDIFSRKNVVIIVGVFLVLLVTIAISKSLSKKDPPPQLSVQAPLETQPLPYKVIGKSVEGREIRAYTHGSGDVRLLLVGGVHGGYEWNGVSLAYEFIDYFQRNPIAIPKNLTVTIIPSTNPDGLFRVIKKEGRFSLRDVPTDTKLLESGRFNTNGVDLNRNFACNWAPKSTWKSRVVSGGTKPFSEPEALALRDFVYEYKPSAAVFWHSKAGAVYASKCNGSVIPETITMMNLYAKAAGYRAFKTFDQYVVTGDTDSWLASLGIPSITVELETREKVEWERNLSGVTALLKHYGDGE